MIFRFWSVSVCWARDNPAPIQSARRRSVIRLRDDAGQLSVLRQVLRSRLFDEGVRMTDDEARHLIIERANYAACGETDFSLHDTERLCHDSRRRAFDDVLPFLSQARQSPTFVLEGGRMRSPIIQVLKLILSIALLASFAVSPAAAQNQGRSAATACSTAAATTVAGRLWGAFLPQALN